MYQDFLGHLHLTQGVEALVVVVVIVLLVRGFL